MNDTYLYGEMFSENILTSYRIYGDRKSLLTPLIILHGGPSGGFDYLLNYRRLADDGRMVIFYDQYGCGRSTHFPHADASFWTIARYLRQLTQLIHHRVSGTGIRYWDIHGAECLPQSTPAYSLPGFAGRYWPVRRPVSPCGNRKAYGSLTL